jgi:ABC-2 type transport system ATP-binding protein
MVLKAKASTNESTVITVPMADPELITALLLTLREEGISLASVNVQEPSLDEVFLALTGETKLEHDFKQAQQGVNRQ